MSRFSSDKRKTVIMEPRDQILQRYIEHLLEHGAPPASVYRFCKDLGIEEKVFFQLFANFHAVEAIYWEEMLDRVIRAVEGGEEWAGFTARQRLLSFLFAFTEESLAHRSLMLVRFGEVGVFSKPPFLRRFAARFKEFAKSLVEEGVENGEVAERGRVSDLYPDGLYIHFRSVIDFHLQDESDQFQRTDAFIEKSVAVAFDLIRTQVLDSAFDLAKFLLPRSMATKGECSRETEA